MGLAENICVPVHSYPMCLQGYRYIRSHTDIYVVFKTIFSYLRIVFILLCVQQYDVGTVPVVYIPVPVCRSNHIYAKKRFAHIRIAYMPGILVVYYRSKLLRFDSVLMASSVSRVARRVAWAGVSSFLVPALKKEKRIMTHQVNKTVGCCG